MRVLAMAALCAAISGCQTAPPPTAAETIAAAGGPVGAYAEKRTSEAKGEKSCYVTQLESAHKEQAAQAEAAKLGLSSPITSDVSNTLIFVRRDGAAAISIAEDTYPGSTEYFLVGGKRFTTREDTPAHLDRDSIDSISRGEVFKYTWTDWPYGGEHDDEDAYVGFQAAYDDCLSFLRH